MEIGPDSGQLSRVCLTKPFLSIEGSPLRTDLTASLSRLNMLKKYPIYLLEISNQKIGSILGHVIDSLPPCTRETMRLMRLSSARLYSAVNAEIAVCCCLL